MTEHEDDGERTSLTVVAVGCPFCAPETDMTGPRRNEGHVGVRFGERGPMVLSATVDGIDVRDVAVEADPVMHRAWLYHDPEPVRSGVRNFHTCCRCRTTAMPSRYVCVAVVSGDVRVVVKRPPRSVNFA